MIYIRDVTIALLGLDNSGKSTLLANLAGGDYSVLDLLVFTLIIQQNLHKQAYSNCDNTAHTE